jgi:hypothetical protein
MSATNHHLNWNGLTEPWQNKRRRKAHRRALGWGAGKMVNATMVHAASEPRFFEEWLEPMSS